MLKEVRCVKCHKPIRLQSSSEESHEIPKVPLEFHCPFCETMNIVLWPKDTEYIIGPAN